MAIHAVCTDFRGEETLDEIPKSRGEAGVPTMKLFLAYKPTPLYMDDYKYSALFGKSQPGRNDHDGTRRES